MIALRHPSLPGLKGPLATRMRSLALWLGLGVIALGALVLVGWAFDAEPLKRVRPGLAAMNPISACTFMLAGAALWLRVRRERSARLSTALALAVALLGALKLVEHQLGWPIGFDRWLFPASLDAPGLPPSRLAPNTALAFVLAGAAIASLHGKGRGILVAQSLALVLAASALTVLFGHFFNAQLLTRVVGFIPMGLHTALGFLALALGVLLARPDRSLMAVFVSPSAGGTLLRRVFWLLLLTPFALSWLRLEGQFAGWFDPAMGIALSTSTMTALIGGLIWWGASVIDREERRRLSDEAALRIELEERVRERTAQLAASEALTHGILEASLDAVIAIDAHGTVIRWNAAAERLFGHAQADAVGRELAGLIIPERFRERHRAGLAHYAATHEGPILGQLLELPGLRADGSEVPLELYIVPIGADGATLFTGFARDVSERKQAEQERARLLAEERQAREAAEQERAKAAFLAEAGETLASSLDYAATLDRVAHIAVPAFAEWCSVHVREPDGQIHQIALAHQDPSKEHWARELQQRYPQDPEAPVGLPAVLRSGEPELVSEIPDSLLEAAAQDAEHLALLRSLDLKSYMVVPLRFHDRILGAISFVSGTSGRRYDQADLAFAMELARRAAAAIENARLYSEARSELEGRIQAEGELRELASELEQRVAGRTAQLDALNKELEAFAYSVSHDLRAPLRGIDGFSQALLEDYANQLDETGKDYLQRVRAGAQRMAQLIEDILKLSRLTRGEMTRQPVDLSALAAEIAKELQAAAPERRVSWEIAPDVRVTGDARLLRVVLENLLSNAFKYTGHHAEAHIRFGAETQGDETAYCVSDDGAGFDPAYAHKLFQPFQRLHAPSEFPGTGIGLATVQRVINRHGGRVWATGATEGGARFCFTLGDGAVDGASP